MTIDTTLLANTERISRLSQVSARRVIEPDAAVTGAFGDRQVLPDELLSVADLGLDLTPTQRAALAREEVASIARFGIRFEATLMSGFAYQLALNNDVTDPRVIYTLHEIAEESRHSRLFARAIEQLQPTHTDLLNQPVANRMMSATLPKLFRRPATFDALVLAGEEIPDLFQKLAAEHPDADPYLRAISHYHRQEEARHLAYARMTIGEHYQNATWSDRFALRWVAPIAVVVMFDLIVQPSAYSTIGLPALATWWRVRRQPSRVALRQQSVKAVLEPLLNADVFTRGRIPMLWRQAAGVDRHGVGPCDQIPGTRPTRAALRGIAHAWDTVCDLSRRMTTLSIPSRSTSPQPANTVRRMVTSTPAL